ncbi:MAG: site-2 protease family protein [Gemmataceae bacterium]
MHVSRPQPWGHRLLLGLVSTAIALPVCFGILMQVFTRGLAGGGDEMMAVALGGVASGFAVFAAHELGHLAGGRLAGLPLQSVTIGLVRVEMWAGRPRWRLNRDWFRHAGIVRFFTPTNERWRVAVMVAAGPATNLAIGAVCLTVAALVNPGPPAAAFPGLARSSWGDVALAWPGSALTAWLNITGLVSLYLGAGTLVPGRAAGLRTDGGQLLDMLIASRRSTAASSGPWPRR